MQKIFDAIDSYICATKKRNMMNDTQHNCKNPMLLFERKDLISMRHSAHILRFVRVYK